MLRHTQTMRASIAALTAVLALVAAGCGSSGSSGGSSGGSSSTPASAPATSGGPAVSMQNIQFSPKAITVKVGQKITWTNDDSVAHNVTATSGGSFKSATLNKGATFSFAPT